MHQLLNYTNLKNAWANNVDLDEMAYKSHLIRTFTVCLLFFSSIYFCHFIGIVLHPLFLSTTNSSSIQSGRIYLRNVRKPWRDIFTYYLLLTTYYLSLITYYLLLITYYLLLITYYLLLIISFITPITAGNSKYTFPVTAVAVVVVVVVVVAVYL